MGASGDGTGNTWRCDRVVRDIFVSFCEDCTNFCVKTMCYCVKII
jgi:hypothetical protein